MLPISDNANAQLVSLFWPFLQYWDINKIGAAQHFAYFEPSSAISDLTSSLPIRTFSHVLPGLYINGDSI
jgi:hypothetical protein